MRQHVLTDEQAFEAWEKYCAGASYAELCAVYHVAKSTLYKAFRRIGVDCAAGWKIHHKARGTWRDTSTEKYVPYINALLNL